MTETVEPRTRVQRLRADATDPLEVLLTAAGDHLEPLLDVGTTPTGDLLLVLPLPAARLTALLETPGWPTAGEAVTVLVPLVQALQRMHDAGAAHGGATAGAVVLDADGAPAWTAPTAPLLLRRAGPARFSAAVDEDRRRFAELAGALAARAGVRLEATGLPSAALVEALFALADPQPVRLDPPHPVVEQGPPARLVAPVAAAPSTPSRVPPALREVLSALARRSSGLRAVRTRTWVVAGCALASLVVALVALPSGSDAGDAGPSAAVVRAAASPAARATPSLTPTAVAPRSLPAERALPLLLAERARCFGLGDATCLDRVVAQGSPVRAADRTALVAGTDPVAPGPGRLKVLSTGGGTVVAAAGGVVVVATAQQDGWRLRDVVAEPPG